MTTKTQQAIASICDEIKNLLLEKNRKYGDSAINPIRIFSKSDAGEQLNVRIDDKLNRKVNQQEDEDEDVDLDLIGYLVLKRVWNRLNESEHEDIQKPEPVADEPVLHGRLIEAAPCFPNNSILRPSWYKTN